MAPQLRGRGGRSNRAGEASIDAIQKACDLRLDADSATIQRAWDDLCWHFRRDHNNGLINEDFPYWILNNISDNTIERMIGVVYAGSSGNMSYAPGLCSHFSVPAWHFNLFLGPLPQNQIRRLRQATKDRRDITFDDLYQELRRIRSQNATLPDGPIHFKPKEIKAIFSDRNPGDDYEDNSEDEAQEDEPQEEDAIYGTGDSDNDYGHDTEQSIANSFDDASYNPANDDSPRDSRSPGIDALEGYATSPIHASSSTSVASPPPGVTATRRSATEDTAILIAGQLDSDRQRQTVDTEEHGARRLPDREPMASILDCTVTDLQQQSARTNDTEDPRLVELRKHSNMLRNQSNILDSSIDALGGVHKGLEQDRLTIMRQDSEVSTQVNARGHTIRELSKLGLTRELKEALKAEIAEMTALCEKHDIIENKHQENQAKRLKYDKDIEELKSKRVEAFRGFAINDTS